MGRRHSPTPNPHSPFPIPHSPFPIPHSPFPVPRSPFPVPRSLLPINAKCDLSRSPSLLNVSAKTGEGVDSLRREIVAALERRAAATAGEASSDPLGDHALSVLCEARQRLAPFVSSAAPLDLVLAANAARAAADSLGSLVGATYSADLLDRLFSRFCVGK